MTMSTKKKPPVLKKQEEQVNKKALIWIGAAFGFIVIVLGVLLALGV
jgi:purine-cytosine permease-like protein